VDSLGMIRIDDWEMDSDVQKKVMAVWEKVTNDNLMELVDVKGFETDFLQLHGFAIPGVDYTADVTP